MIEIGQKVVLFGSGETSPTGRFIHEQLFQEIGAPVHVAILETPAGFEPNSALVAGKIKEFMELHLQNFHPEVVIIPARKKGSPFSPDDPNIVTPLLFADYIFLGPGSPTYSVRQLSATLAYQYLVDANRRGTVLSLASAAAIAFGAYALPVYEIYKVGTDLHWVRGLDFFGQWGLELAIVTHWNNAEGGQELDTSCCYMGVERMAALWKLLPDPATLLGIDEHTAVVLDGQRRTGAVMGKKGTATIRSKRRSERVYSVGDSFSFDDLN